MTTRRGRKRHLWRYVAGEYPATVAVEERELGGVLYERVWDPSIKRQRRRSLGHRDKEQGRKHAEHEAEKLRAGLAPAAGPVTLGRVLQEYLALRTPQRWRPASRRIGGRPRCGCGCLAPDSLVRTLGPAEWHSFIALRTCGAVDARGRSVPEGNRTLVSPRTVDTDLVFLIAVFNWAVGWNTPDGSKLIEKNPWGAELPGVKRTLERPTNRAPRRPVATYDRYLAVRAAAEQVTMRAKGRGTVRSYLPELLELVEQTGRRISAVLGLRYDDIVRHGRDIVAIRWRPVKHSDEQVIPVSSATRDTLQRVLQERSSGGGTYLFPSPMRRSGVERPLSKDVAARWLRDAEKKANVPHLEGGGFHPYRRKWATERKHLPDRDVAEVGGWKTLTVLKNVYQQTDPETMLVVLNEPRKLVEQRADGARPRATRGGPTRRPTRTIKRLRFGFSGLPSDQASDRSPTE